jgi:lipid II:glycine glycyltransferase (peptidoglycan interpeptide bridge formation enzyme)
MPKSKISAFASVLLVFASGAAMGAVGYRLYEVKTVVSPVQAKKKMSPEESRRLATSHLKDAVKLTDQQIVEVQKIYDWQGDQFMPLHKKTQAKIDQDWREFEQQRDQIHEEAVAKTKAILTPEQLPLYEKYLADRAADRKKRQQEQQQGPGQHKDGRRPPLP